MTKNYRQSRSIVLIHLGILLSLASGARAQDIKAPSGQGQQDLDRDPARLGKISISETTRETEAAPTVSPTEGLDNRIAKTLNIPQKIEGFSALRHLILETIAGAQSRVWLTTDFLSDGEIVTALYLAQYRKLDVKVLLGRKKAQSLLSRLNYLKQQKVPVWLRPDSFKTPTASALLIDDNLLLVDAELDSMTRARLFDVKPASSEQIQNFLRDFTAAAAMEIPAIGATMPMVGRAFTGGRTYDAGSNSNYNGLGSDGAYRYGRKREPRPHGVSDKLPKRTKWQERDRNPLPLPESSRP